MLVKISAIICLVYLLGLQVATATTPVKAKLKIKEAQDFVKSVPLNTQILKREFMSDVKASQGTNTTNYQKQGFVDSGSLVSFTDKLTGQNKDDILNSVLFCSLAADYQYNKLTQTDEWYDYYGDTMEKIGWVMQNFTFEHYHPGSGTFSIDKVVLDILAAIASEDELVIAQQLLAALKNLADNDNRLVLFEGHSYNSEAGNFQVSPCSQDDSGQVVMALSGFHFMAQENEERFLFFEWNSEDIDIFTSTQTITLDMDVYSAVRQIIIQKLGEQAVNLVKNIPIA